MVEVDVKHREQLNLDDVYESNFLIVENKESTRFDTSIICLNVLILRMFAFCICGILHDLIVTEWGEDEIFYILGLTVFEFGSFLGTVIGSKYAQKEFKIFHKPGKL